MKKIRRTFFLFTAGMIGFAGYDQLYMKSQKLPVEMTASNSLAQADQDRISVSPKDATVKRVWYERQLAHEVTFHHTETESLGELVVYVGMDREIVLGQKNNE